MKEMLAMSRLGRRPANAVALAARTAIFSMLLAAPVLAVPGTSGGQGQIIEAPAAEKTGMGLVLLFSLQRA